MLGGKFLTLWGTLSGADGVIDMGSDDSKNVLKSLENNWDWFGRVDPLWAISSFNDKRGNKWDDQEFFRTGFVEIEKIMKYLESQNIEIRHHKALDFGCGVGRLTQALAKHFDFVDGLDIALLCCLN